MIFVILQIEIEHKKATFESFLHFIFGKMLSSLLISAIMFSGSMVIDLILSFGFAISNVNVG